MTCVICEGIGLVERNLIVQVCENCNGEGEINIKPSFTDVDDES